MKQKEFKTLPTLMVLATTIVGALEQFAAAIGLHHVTKAIFEAAANDLVAARDDLDAAKVELAERRTMLKLVVLSTRGFLTSARDVLKNTLGKKKSAVWDTAGFRGSFAVPTDPDQLQLMVQSLKTFLTDNPTKEVAQFDLTALRASTLLSELIAAQLAVKAQLGVITDLTAARDAKAGVVKGLIVELIQELTMKLDPLDGKWLQFGLNRPGAVQTPDVPQNITAVLIGNSAVAVKWAGAPRAKYYRVWKKVNGLDEELIAVGNPSDVDFTVEGLPANSTIEIAVSAVNDGGESVTSEVVTIVTH